MSASTRKVIIVEGNIGAGKSTFAPELATTLTQLDGGDTLVLHEPTPENGGNVYLDRFYKDRPRWAFTMQMHLLGLRYRNHLRAQYHAMQGAGHAVLDRSFYFDTAFARLQLAGGDMLPEEFETYCNLYHAMTAHVLLPSALVLLQVPPQVCAERIAQRAGVIPERAAETAVDLAYLFGLAREISYTASALVEVGVPLVSVAWEVPRGAAIERHDEIEHVARALIGLPVRDLFVTHTRRQ